MKSKSLFALASLGLAGVLLNGCGSSTSGGGANLSLSKGIAALPSLSGMVAANGSRFLSQRAVVGNPPLVKDLKKTNLSASVSNDADTVFFNGFLKQLLEVADQNAWNSLDNEVKDDIRNNYQGADTFAGGTGACYMVQDTGRTIDSMLSNGTSACYVRKIPKAAGEDEEVFSQGASDKLVKVIIQNMEQSRRTSRDDFYVFVKVFGTNSVGTNRYKAELYFCENTNPGTTAMPGGEGPGGLESFEINKVTGLFTASGRSPSYSSDASAYLKQNSQGDLEIDLNQAREAIYYYSNGGSTGKDQVTVTPANKIYSKKFYKWGSQENKSFSVASFSGGSVADLRFLEGAYKGAGSGEFSGTPYLFTYQGAAEFNTSYYKSNILHPFLSEMPANFTDSFYTEPSVTAPVMTAYPCDAVPDTTITADFDQQALKDVQTECEGDRLNEDQDSWTMCGHAQELGKEHFLWMPPSR